MTFHKDNSNRFGWRIMFLPRWHNFYLRAMNIVVVQRVEQRNVFWCIYFKSIIKMVHNFNKINPWSKWHNTARSVLINSSRTTNKRMVYILLRFYFSLFMFCGLTPSLFTAKKRFDFAVFSFSHDFGSIDFVIL